MTPKEIRKALRAERVLICTHETRGTSYSLDNGVPISKKLAAELTATDKLEALFLYLNEDGLFPGFTQT
jgi:hypothetical protein